MKSPFTGGSVTKLFKYETYTFRNEKYEVKRYYYKCDDTGREFSDAEVDNEAIESLHEQYRLRYGIPSPADLKELRTRYGFSAHTMSKIAGIGINQYGLYENGEVPTLVVGMRLGYLFFKAYMLKSIETAKHRLGKDYLRVKEAVEAYEEPVSYPFEKVYYNDYVEVVSFKLPFASFAMKNPRWATSVI
ncbi:MAG: hypothetical protein J5771_03755 [Bacteroidales bacterium]|nr:hypothetical protein [Bacteroidales bacterium]